MKPLILVTALAALAGPAVHAEWFEAHNSPEPCVRLSDLNFDGTRSYYGTGDMHTPADYERYFHRLGIRLERDPRSNERVINWWASVGDYHTNLTLFADRDECLAFMASVGR